MKRITALILVLSLMLFAAGCSNSSTESNTTKDTTASSETSSDATSADSNGDESAEFEGKLAWYAPAPHPYSMK